MPSLKKISKKERVINQMPSNAFTSKNQMPSYSKRDKLSHPRG